MRTSWRKRLAAAFFAVGLTSMGLGVAAPGATAAAGSIDFIAAGPGTYDHTDPGDPTPAFSYNGRNISKTDGVVEALLGADFRCGDKVVFFAAIPYTETDAGDIELAFEFSTETTGHKANTPTVGFKDQTAAVKANVGDAAHTSTGGAITGPTFSTGNKTFTATVGVTGIDAGSTFILRVTTEIFCEPNAQQSDQNGNLQASMDPLPPAKGGAQTINLRSPGDLVVPTAALTIRKTSVNGVGTFTFDVDCTGTDYDSGATDPSITTTQAGVQATVGAGSFPVGLECTVTENDPGTGWTVDPVSRSRTVTIADGGSTADFTNTAAGGGGTPQGTLQVDKDVQGFAGDAFEFDVTCTKTGETDVTFPDRTVTGAGTWSETVPAGFACTVTEDTTKLPAPGTGFAWDAPTYSNNGVTVTDGGTHTVTIHNTRSATGGGGGGTIVTPTSFGTLTVSKAVQNGAGGEQFRFVAVCGGETDEFILGDGQSTTIFDIPAGTTCTVTEELPAPTDTTRWTNVIADSTGVGDGVVLVDGDETVAVTNIRTVVAAEVVETTTTTSPPPATSAPAITSPPPSVGGAVLARTGADTGTVLLYAGIALVLGGLLIGWAELGERTAPVMVRRRR